MGLRAFVVAVDTRKHQPRPTVMPSSSSPQPCLSTTKDDGGKVETSNFIFSTYYTYNLAGLARSLEDEIQTVIHAMLFVQCPNVLATEKPVYRV